MSVQKRFQKSRLDESLKHGVMLLIPTNNIIIFVKATGAEFARVKPKKKNYCSCNAG
jgi:hypothetical protein